MRTTTAPRHSHPRDSALVQAVRRLEATSPSQADALAVLVREALKIYAEHQAELEAQERRDALLLFESSPRRRRPRPR